jgi:hypothetical protein
MVVFGWVITLLRQCSDNTLADEAPTIALWSLPVTMRKAPLAAAGHGALDPTLDLGAAHVVASSAAGSAQKAA